MKKQTKIIIIITLLLTLLLGVYIYKNLFNKEELRKPDMLLAGKTAGDAQVSFEYSNDVDVKVEQIKSNLEVPNLNKKIVFNISLNKEEKEKIEEKIKEVINSLEEDNSFFDGWIALGSYRKQIADYTGAIEVWTYASKIAPLSIVPLNNLGNLYHYQLKNYEKAEEFFKKAIEIGPTYINSYLNLYDLYTLSYKQNTDNAEKILLEGLKNNPNQINFILALAEHYRKEKNNNKSLGYYNQALEQLGQKGDKNLISEIQKQIDSLK